MSNSRIIRKALSTGSYVQLITLITHISITPIMVIAQRGEFAMLNSIIGMITPIICLGFPSALSRRLIHHNVLSIDYVWKLIFYMSIQLITVLTLLGLFLKVWSGSILTYGISVYLIVFLIFLKLYGQAILLGAKNYRAFQISKILPVLSLLILVVMTVFFYDFNLTILLWVWVLSELAVFFYQIFTLKSFPVAIKQETNGNDFSDDRLFGLKGLLGQASFLEGYKLDQIVLGFVVTPSSLAIYAVAKSVASSLRFVSNSLAQIALPLLCAESSKKGLLGVFVKIETIGLGVVVAASIAAALISNFYLITIIGPQYKEVLVVLPILILSMVIYSPRRISYEYFRAIGLPQYSSLLELIVIGIFGLHCIYIISNPFSSTIYAISLATVVSNAVGFGAVLYLIFWIGKRDV